LIESSTSPFVVNDVNLTSQFLTINVFPYKSSASTSIVPGFIKSTQVTSFKTPSRVFFHLFLQYCSAFLFAVLTTSATEVSVFTNLVTSNELSDHSQTSVVAHNVHLNQIAAISISPPSHIITFL
jgi:hypothetical protein